MSGRQMRLTPAHLVPLRREISDPGHPEIAGFRAATDDDYDAVVSKILAGRPQGQPFYVFAYGSLIWNPEFEFASQHVVEARGWHRGFNLGWDRRYRGNAEQPGLMMALDRGGRCKGVIFELPEAGLRAQLDRLLRREMSMVPTAFPARWIFVRRAGEVIKALTFAMDRKSPRYVARLADAELADVLARACGFRGSMAEYLYATTSKLEELGIYDRHLWTLQALVAERIEQLYGPI